jgi:hypothetical protein
MEKGLASWVKSFKNAFSFSKRPKAGSEMALPFLCTFQIVILNIQNYHGVNISRWNGHRLEELDVVQASIELSLKNG